MSESELHVSGVERPTAGAGAVRRALAVLGEIGRARDGLTVAELSKRLALTKPTAHRLVAALTEEGFLRATSSPQRLRLGPVFLELAHAAWHHTDIREAAASELERLASLTGHTARLLIQSGGQAVCVEAVHAGERQRAVDVGSVEPFASSAAGRAIMAFASRKPPSEPSGANANDALTKARFYAIDDNETLTGWRSVAAPVFDERSEPVAAIAVSAPSHLLTSQQLHEIAPEVLEAARNTSRAAGGYPFAISPVTTGSDGRSATIKILCRASNLIGDSPVWDNDRRLLCWIDILGPAIHTLDRDGNHVRVPMPDVIGALVPSSDGRLLAGFTDSIAWFSRETKQLGRRIRIEGLPVGCRFNDGGFDPRGRLWLGSIDPSIEGGSGRLLQIDQGGKVCAHLSGLGLPNGIVWSSETGCAYIADSSMRELRAYDYDEALGRFGDYRVLQRFAADGPRPVGLALSSRGTLWTALWDGWELVEIGPEGGVLDRIALPVPRPSGLCYADDVGRLIVTSARVRLSPSQILKAPQSGSVLECVL